MEFEEITLKQRKAQLIGHLAERGIKKSDVRIMRGERLLYPKGVVKYGNWKVFLNTDESIQAAEKTCIVAEKKINGVVRKYLLCCSMLFLIFAAQLSAQKEGKEPWRDEDLRVPHRFIPVTLLEAVNVIQHKAPYLLANNNVRVPVFLQIDRPVPVSIPAIIPIVHDTVYRVCTVEKPVYIDRVDTLYTQFAMPERIVYRDINVTGRHDTIQTTKTEYVTKTEYASSPFDIALRVCVVLLSLGICFPSFLQWMKS